MPEILGFIVDAFAGTRDGRAIFYALGRLENGETFGIVDDRSAPALYVRVSDREKVPLARAPQAPLATMDGEALLELRTPDVRAYRRLADHLQRRGVRTYGGDLDFAHVFLMERGLRGSVRLEGAWRPGEHVSRVYVNPTVSPADGTPDLRVLSFDIETDLATDRVLAVSLVTFGAGADSEEVMEDGDEHALLEAFAARVRVLDPDVLTGWNIADFDLPVLARRMARFGKELDLGRTRAGVGRPVGKLPPLQGRQMLDAMRLVRASGKRYEDLRLATVARQVLGRGKVLQAGEHEDQPAKIMETYLHDRATFLAYCLEDSRLVRDIVRQEKLIDLTVSRTRLIGLPLAKTWGSVASFEFLYMGELRRRGFVAPSHGVDFASQHEVPGGLVLAPEAGMHEHILVFDFRSLYPSLIRSFNIDPLALAQAKGGAMHHQPRSILPEILDRFFESRAAAQRDGDEVAAYAYKIIMNSFYGVLGTASCRFAAPALAGGITGRGHEILRWTRDHLERNGMAVRYGDTDSIFLDAQLAGAVTPAAAVQLGRELAAEASAALADHLHATYGVASRLELKFEKYYRWLLLPPSRTGASRAKSYAGLKRDERGGEKVEIVGMEAVRSDWTPLARELQRELLTMLFAGKPAAALERHVRDVIDAVRAGQRDEDLVYRKQMRRSVEAYTATTPPHVRAARMLPKTPRVVRYVMTVSGPQPLGLVSARVDHPHYVEKQIMPIVAMLAGLSDFDPDKACRASVQRGLFE